MHTLSFSPVHSWDHTPRVEFSREREAIGTRKAHCSNSLIDARVIGVGKAPVLCLNRYVPLSAVRSRFEHFCLSINFRMSMPVGPAGVIPRVDSELESCRCMLSLSHVLCYR